LPPYSVLAGLRAVEPRRRAGSGPRLLGRFRRRGKLTF
jgi:hypothetical protein